MDPERFKQLEALYASCCEAQATLRDALLRRIWNRIPSPDSSVCGAAWPPSACRCWVIPGCAMVARRGRLDHLPNEEGVTCPVTLHR